MLLGGFNEMRKLIWASLVALLVLSACGNDNDSTDHGAIDDGEGKQQNQAIGHSAEKTDSGDREVGFNLNGETIEEAQNVPEDEKANLIVLLDNYIATFNDKEIDAYMNTLSETTESFDLEEERAYMLDIFERYGVDREISETTITMYEEDEAHIFTRMTTVLTDLESKDFVELTGRQVTVMTKDEGEWKISSVHYVGDDPEEVHE